MYKELFILAIGIILGILLMYFIVKSEIGDDYEIYKPKQRGNSNRMTIDQKNIKPLKRAKKAVILKRWRNKRLTKKQNK